MAAILVSTLLALFGLVVVPALLRSTRVFDVRPRVGLVTWYVLGLVGWIGVVALALRVALGTGRPLVPAGLDFLRHLGDGHPLRGLGLSEVFGLSVAFDVVALLVGGWVSATWSIWRERRAQRSLLDLVADLDRSDPSLRYLRHDQPVAYYLPGSGGRIVISRGTRAVLRDDELEAVIAHEHGHGAGHHGSLLVPLRALSPFVSFLPYARYAPPLVAAYLEMAADDHARRATSTSALRRALAKAGVLSVPPLGALGLTSSFVDRRILRLDRRSTPVTNLVSYALLGVIVGSITWVLLTSH